jgi:hypothetical protein
MKNLPMKRNKYSSTSGRGVRREMGERECGEDQEGRRVNMQVCAWMSISMYGLL